MKLNQTAKYISSVVLFAAACFVTGRLSLMMALIEKETLVSTTPFWLPIGIGVGGLLLYGLRLWPGLWLGQFFTSITTGITPWLAATISTGSLVAVLFSVYWECASGLLHTMANLKFPAREERGQPLKPSSH